MDKVDLRFCRVGNSIGPNQVYFRPAVVFQELFDDHVCDGGLDFKLNFQSGRNMARFASGVDIEEGSARQLEILASQLRVIDDSEQRSDAAAVSAAPLRSASAVLQ